MIAIIIISIVWLSACIFCLKFGVSIGVGGWMSASEYIKDLGVFVSIKDFFKSTKKKF